MLEDSLYEYIKGLLRYVGADIVSREELEELDELRDQLIENVILDMAEEYKVKGMEFGSAEKVEEYLKQAADDWKLRQLASVQSDHDYLDSPSITHNKCSEPNDEGYGSHCEEGTGEVKSEPSSTVDNLRGPEKVRGRDSILL